MILPWAFYKIWMDVEIPWEFSWKRFQKTPVAITIWNELQNYHRQQQLMSLKGSKRFVPEFSLQKIIHFGGAWLLKVDCREKNLNSTAEIGEALSKMNFPKAVLPKIGKWLEPCKNILVLLFSLH